MAVLSLGASACANCTGLSSDSTVGPSGERQRYQVPGAASGHFSRGFGVCPVGGQSQETLRVLCSGCWPWSWRRIQQRCGLAAACSFTHLLTHLMSVPKPSALSCQPASQARKGTSALFIVCTMVRWTEIPGWGTGKFSQTAVLNTSGSWRRCPCWWR